MPEITVIVTTYRLENHIALCLDELLAQTYQDFDILIVDDCSPDSTPEILATYQKRYSNRVRTVLLQKNLGSPAKTRNTALDSGLIDGKYVLFLDGDDRLEPTMLERLHEACVRNESDVAVCAYDRVELETGHVLCRELQWISGTVALPPTGDDVVYLNGAIWNKLFLTEKIGDIRIPDFRVGEDICFALRVFARCQKIAFVPDELIHYQVRKNSVIANTDRSTMHAFAAELAQQYAEAKGGWRDVIALISFLHIGLSMALRAVDNPDISTREYIRWARGYMRDMYGFYRGVRLMQLPALCHRGAKGLVIWASLCMYRLNCFDVALWLNRALTRLFHVDFKF